MFSGFAELDVIHDSTQSFAEVSGSAPVARPGTLSAGNDRLQFSPRITRIAFTVLPPVQWDWKTRAHLEFDLLGAPNSAQEASFFTSPTLRIRHAFYTAEKNGWRVLVGQYWTLFGWQMNYILPTVSIPPFTAVLFQRMPQVLVIKTIDALQIAGALNRPVQRDSGLPGLDVGLRYSFESWQGGYTGSPTGDEGVAPMSFALTGTLRDYQTPRGTGDPGARSHQTGYGVALNGMIPIIPSSDGKNAGGSLVLTGEATVGAGYGDAFALWTGGLKSLTATDTSFAPTSVNLDAGIGGFEGGAFKLVKLSTFNLDLQYHLPAEWRTYFNVGYAQLHSSNAASLTPNTGQPYYRSEAFFVNVYHDFTNEIRVALEYAYFKTKYGDGVEPHNRRVQVSTWFRI